MGRAGKLLTSMIEAMGLQRHDVYICNVVKCRPPENRLPEPDEIKTCSPFFDAPDRYGRPAGDRGPPGSVRERRRCCKRRADISHFRGQWQEFRGDANWYGDVSPGVPAAESRPAKADVWKDLQMVMAELGLQAPKKR